MEICIYVHIILLLGYFYCPVWILLVSAATFWQKNKNKMEDISEGRH